MDRFLIQVLSVIVAVCILFFYFYKSQNKTMDNDIWEEEEIELITAEDPDHTIFTESIKSKGKYFVYKFIVGV